jgi:release factor glutamine methyltransferase
VAPGVFIPRPETELLVEEAGGWISERLARHGADDAEPLRVLDLCTGTGAVAVALARRFRSDPRVELHAGDWSLRAVYLARRNAGRNDVRVAVRRSDLFSAFADLEGAVDVVVANPPYVAPHEEESLPVEVRMGDPAAAVFDPEGGTGFHRRIAARAHAFLRPGGLLAMEIGERQGAEVTATLRGAAYEDVTVRRDLAGRDRVVRGRRPTSTPSS